MNISFAPGPVPQKFEMDLSYSHRSKEFQNCFFHCQNQMQLLTGRRVLFVGGSASAAIEAVFAQFVSPETTVGVLVRGTFAERAFLTAGLFSRKVLPFQNLEAALNFIRKAKPGMFYAVQFETSNSTYNDLTELLAACRRSDVLSVVDVVSGFPYYELPVNADVVVLSSSKLLRGLPVLGMVGIRPELEHLIKGVPARSEYLSLVLAAKYSMAGNTPHTSLIPQFLSLEKSLVNREWEEFVWAIDKNCRQLLAVLPEVSRIGCSVAPVLSVRTKKPRELLEFARLEFGMELYHNWSYMKDYVQVGMYNYKTDAYTQLAGVLQLALERGLL